MMRKKQKQKSQSYSKEVHSADAALLRLKRLTDAFIKANEKDKRHEQPTTAQRATQAPAP